MSTTIVKIPANRFMMNRELNNRSYPKMKHVHCDGNLVYFMLKDTLECSNCKLVLDAGAVVNKPDLYSDEFFAEKFYMEGEEKDMVYKAVDKVKGQMAYLTLVPVGFEK